MKTGKKEFQVAGVKSSKAAEVTPEVMAKVNQFAINDLTAEQVYVRKFFLAHNGVDRDRERFPEEMLEDFAATLPGKNFLFAHDRGKFLPIGLWFDTETQTMTPEEYKALTREEIRLPDGISEAKVLVAWAYVLKNAENEGMIGNLDAGIYRHVSIGFSAKAIDAVKGELDQILYWEYKGPGEATEGSLVWLGAQQGATNQKNFDDNEPDTTEDTMEKLKELLDKLKTKLGKNFSTENAADEIAALFNEKADQVMDLEQKIVDLTPLAEDGKKYREELCAEYARMKTALEVQGEETEKSIKSFKDVADSLPIEFLKIEVKTLEARMEKTFPDSGQLKGDDRKDKSEDDKAADEENPLIPKQK